MLVVAVAVDLQRSTANVDDHQVGLALTIVLRVEQRLVQRGRQLTLSSGFSIEDFGLADERVVSAQAGDSVGLTGR